MKKENKSKMEQEEEKESLKKELEENNQDVKQEEEEGEENAIDAILDPENSDPVTLYGAKDDDYEMKFEQIAVIPINDNLYAILRPLEEVEGIEKDQGVVFEIVEEKEEFYLNLVEDSKVIDEVFEKYTELAEEE